MLEGSYQLVLDKASYKTVVPKITANEASQFAIVFKPSFDTTISLHNS